MTELSRRAFVRLGSAAAGAGALAATGTTAAAAARRGTALADGAMTVSGMTAGGTAAAGAAGEATAGRLPGRTPSFDLTAPAEPFLVDVGLHDQRTIMQSFAVDRPGGHVYVVQITQGGTILPGDAPGDEEYARRAARGDLTLSKLDLAGNLLGHMYLKRFGHGVAIGVERSGHDVHLWTEVDAVTEGASGWGTRLLRFPFADGAVVDADTTPGLQRRELLPGVDRTTCNVDPVHRTLVMRYRRDGAFRFALFDLDDVRRERAVYEPLADIAQPDVLSGGPVFQGYATYGRDLYLFDGQIYSDANPPGGQGNAHLTRVDWRTGAVAQRVRTTDGHELHRREPEGLGVWLATPGRRPTARLGFAFGTSRTADPDDDRLCTILTKSLV